MYVMEIGTYVSFSKICNVNQGAWLIYSDARIDPNGLRGLGESPMGRLSNSERERTFGKPTTHSQRAS